MAQSNKDLLDLEQKKLSPLESTFLVCRKNLLSQTEKPQPYEKPITTSVPTSQVLGKVKDFLANQKLQLVSQENSQKDYNIEALNGNETEYIEMDLMLGVADLHTPEAVAAAESAMASSQPAFSLSGRNSGPDSEDTVDESSDDDTNDDTCSKNLQKPKNGRAKKRSKIIELQ